MSDLHQIPRKGTGEPRADVIFVHGLGGDPFASWWHDSKNPKDSWPFWLAEELPEVQVHCLEYEATPANWLAPSLPLVERAQNILAVLLGKSIGKRPIVFVCHSLGGLLIKQMLRKTHDENIDVWRRLAGQIKAVVFFGTPHRGAELADTLFRLGKYLGASPSVRDLQTHNGLLKDLNDWFAGHAAGLGITPHCFYETQPTTLGMIVPKDSGDIGVPGVPRYPVDADHGAICKPGWRDHYLCGYLASVVREVIGAIVVPRQLPEDPPHFVGREEELQRLLAALEAGGKATVTAINGMGGVGKSALAIHAAYRLGARAPDGQIYVELGGASERPLTALEAMTAIYKAFDPEAHAPPDEQSAIKGYRRMLAGKRALLVLDNAKDAGTVAPLVKHLPQGCVLIITSREAMPFGEITTIGLEELPADESSRLLRELLGPERASNEEVRTLATRCGCLPLALHAAGAYLTRQRNLRVATYLAALAKERGRLEAFRIKGLQSLDVATVLGFSIRHLREDDARLAERWRQLSVFPTSFDLMAAAAVWQTDETEAEMALQELTARSMVRFEPTSERYSLHDLMRELAYVLLEDEDQAVLKQRLEDAASRHAQHYCGVLAAADELYLVGGENVLRGLRLYDLDQRNIAAGQAWAVGRIEISDEAARLAANYANAGVYVLGLRLPPRSWIGWLEAQLKASRRLGDRRVEGEALGNLGLSYTELGEPRRAIEYHQQALTIAREIGDRQHEGAALGNLGMAYADLGEPRQAIECYEQDLVIARDIRDRRGEGAVLGNLGQAYAALGEVQRAVQHYQRQLAVVREIGDRRLEGDALGNLGRALSNLGEPRRAMQHFEQQLAIAREIGDRRGEANALGSLGAAYGDLGDPQRAIQHFKEQRAIAGKMGDRRGEANALGNLGNVYDSLGEPRRAIEHYEQTLAIAHHTSDRRSEGNALGSLGNAYADLGEPRRAIDHYEQSLKIAREIGDRRGEGSALGNLGLAYADLGELRRAIEHHEQSLAIMREIGDRQHEGATLGNLGSAYSHLGELRRAIEYHQRALVISRELGDRRAEAQDLGNLGNAYFRLGEPRRAIEYHEQDLTIAREVGDRRGEGQALGNLGLAYADLGKPRRAIEHYEERLAIAREVGDRRGEGRGLYNSALAFDRLGERDEAIRRMAEAFQIYEEIQDPSREDARAKLAEWRGEGSG